MSSTIQSRHRGGEVVRAGPPGRRAPLRLPQGRWVPLALGALAIVAVLFFGSRLLDLKSSLETLDAIEDILAAFTRSYLLPTLLLALAYYVLKALRWHFYLREAGVPVRPGRAVGVYLAGQWFAFTPAGELARACLLGKNVDLARVAPTILVQGVTDFVALALLATVTVAFYPHLAPVVLPVTLPVLLTVTMLSLPPLRRFVAGWRLAQSLASTRWGTLLEQSANLLGPRPTFVGLAIGLPAMLFGGLAFFLVGLAVGLPDWTPLAALAVYGLSQLLGGLSPLPQGLGVTEGSGTLLLGYLGVDASLALLAMLLFRATVLVFAAALGLASLLFLRLRG